MAVTKESIVQSVVETGFNKSRSMELVDTLLEIIKRSLTEGEDVLVSGFGKFCVKEKGERRGRNPQTGNALKLEARKIVTFNSSEVLKERVNGGKGTAL